MSDEDRRSEVASLEDDFSGGNEATSSDLAETDQLGKGFRKEKASKANFFAEQKTKLIGGGLLGGGVAGLIFGSFLLLPLKVQHIVDNLQDHSFSAAEDATEKMTDSLLRSYLVKKVMPGMISGRCSSTLIDKNCVAASNGEGPVNAMYNAWRDAKFEQKLAEKGVILERSGNNFKLVTPSTLREGGIDLGNFDTSNTRAMDQNLKQTLSRGEVRREVRAAFEGETFSKRIMYRYKVGRLMERKYGIVRCVMACNTKDRFRDSVDQKKTAWKVAFAKRIIQPLNESYGLAIQCALDDFNCTDTPEADEKGEQRSKLEQDLSTSVNKASITDVENENKSDEERKAQLEQIH